jgi:transposase
MRAKNYDKKSFEKMSVVNAHAAGIDVGSKSHFVSIGQEKHEVREFGCYTNDLHELCRWLKGNEIDTVALESTGSYWKSLFVLLQDYQLNPILVNGKFTKNVKGKKTDVLDCQWIQKLHTLGLLEGSFIPDLFTESIRQYSRHRQTLIENAAGYIKKMQKALRMTNIRLDIALNDIMGASGRAIINAILNGEREPEKLAALVHVGVKKSREEIVTALTGDWREEYLFELKQSYEVYQYLRSKIVECDKQIEQLLGLYISDYEKTTGEVTAVFNGKIKAPNRNDPQINLQVLSFQLTGGIDLSAVPGIGKATLLSLLSETGVDLKVFPTARHFAGWLRLAPNNKVSGGKVISNRTGSGKNRLADALRHAANAIGNKVKEGALHHFFKRIAYKKGRLAAVTGTARKIAVIIWNMLVKRQPYQPANQSDYLLRLRDNQIKNMQKKIRQLQVMPDELIFSTL